MPAYTSTSAEYYSNRDLVDMLLTCSNCLDGMENPLKVAHFAQGTNQFLLRHLLGSSGTCDACSPYYFRVVVLSGSWNLSVLQGCEHTITDCAVHSQPRCCSLKSNAHSIPDIFLVESWELV